jgi:hypothetical protein
MVEVNRAGKCERSVGTGFSTVQWYHTTLKMGWVVTQLCSWPHLYIARSFPHSAVLFVEVERSSKTFVLIYRITGCHTSEDPNCNHCSLCYFGILKLMELWRVSLLQVRNPNQFPTEYKARGYDGCAPVFRVSLCLQGCLEGSKQRDGQIREGIQGKKTNVRMG